MRKTAKGIAAALFILGSPTAFAQGTSGAPNAHDAGPLSQTEFKILTDARIAMVRVALQLTPEQVQYWPAVEDAIRARSEARYRRLSALGDRVAQWRDADPVQLYRQRAEGLAERAAGLKKLADAWQPLYQTLSPDQKMRLRVVAMRAFESARAGVESRRMEIYEEDDSEF